MTFRGVALRRLNGLPRTVTNDLATSGAAQDRGRCTFARVLSVGEAQLASTAGAAAARFGLGRSVGCHHAKSTASDEREAVTG